MKSKEEILFEESNKELPEGIYPGMATTKIYNAMEEYAKQKGMAFGEWIYNNSWYICRYPDIWSHQFEDDSDATTSELYDIFIQETTSNDKH